MQNHASRSGEIFTSADNPSHPHTHPEHTLVITSFKRLIAALVIILPAAALVTSPVMAASHAKAKHHTSVHKASAHKHARKASTSTAS
jgi:hypothetical protein